MKLTDAKQTVESNIQATINVWYAELHSVKCEMEMLTLSGSVYDLCKSKRNHYRNLVEYRQDVTEYINILKADLATVSQWTIDTFRSYLLSNDEILYSWLGWKN